MTDERSPGPALLPGMEGKVAFIAGLAGGIGRAVAVMFAEAGMKVAGGDLVHPDPMPDGVWSLKMDATDERQVIAAIGAAADRYGKLDVVVNAAGKTGKGPLADMSLADWKAMLDINLTSAFLLAREAYPRLRKPGGSLILFSSTNGRNGGTVYSGPAYGAAKAGIINLTRYLAREWAPDGLRVNCVAPGPVQTPMLDRLSAEEHKALKAGIPLGRYTSAEQVAAATAFLVSPHGGSMTGTVINQSGGLVYD